MPRKAIHRRRAPRAKSNPASLPSRRFHASFEALEAREMLAADDLLIGLYAGGGVARYDLSASPAAPIQGAGAVAAGDHGLTNVSGIATAPDGTFYASNAKTEQVVHYSNWGAYLGAFAASGVTTPGTLAFGPNGDLYVADTAGGTVSWFNTSTGAKDGSITLPSNDTPGGIAFAHNGDLIVGDLTSGAVLQFNTSSGGTSSTALVAAGTAVGNNTGGAFVEPVAILAQNNGNLLIADASQTNQSAHEQVVLYSASTKTTSQFIGLSAQPQTLLRAEDGNLLIGLAPNLTSTNGGEVQEYNISSGAAVGSPIATGIAAPGALAYAPATLSDLLLGDFDDSSVLRYDATSLASPPLVAVPGSIPTSGGTAPNQWSMAQTSNTTVAPDGTIYVSSLGTGQVLHFSADGQTLLGVFASFGGSINVAAPGALAFGPNGDLYIADFGYAGSVSPPIPAVPANVSWYNTATGHQDGTITLPNNGAGTTPGALAFAQNGDLLVSNLGDGSVTEFNSANVGTTLIAPFSPVGNDPAPNAYLMPSSIVVLPNGNFLIADENYDNSNDHHQIVLYNASTGALSQFINLTTPVGTQTGKVGDFAQPESMLISHRGTLLVEVSPDHAHNGAIQEYNLTTGALINTLVSGIGTPAGLVYARPSPARTTPTITWPTPAAITYGAALTTTQLDATTTPAGTFTYTLADGSTPALGAVLPAGEQTLNVLFTPNAPNSYTSAIGQVEINVLPATLTVTANSASRAYGAAEPTFTDTITGFVHGDTSSVVGGAASFTSTDSITSAPGGYSIMPAQGTLSAANYTFTFVAGALTVNQAALTITANNISKTYGQTTSFVGTEFTTSGLVNGDTVTSVTLVSAGAADTASVSGSPYSIVPSTAIGTGLSNYKITYASGKLTVNQAALTITADDASKTYGQTKTFAGTEFTTSGLVNGDSVASATLNSTGAAATADVSGSPYPIVPSAALGTGLANYAITYDNGTLTVNAAALTITASNIGKTYGQTETFAGTEFTTAGLLNGDTVTSVTLSSTGAAATALVSGSPYQIAPSAAVGTGLGNYSITYDNGQLTVNVAPLTITADNTSKTYGQTTAFAGTEFTTNGLVNGDTVSSVSLNSTGAAATAGVGGSPDPIVPSAALGTGLANYTITYDNGQLTVNAAPLTVTADNTSKTYGQTTTFAGTEFTANGLVNGDTVTSVSLTSAGSSATAGVSGSPYSIMPSAAQGTGLANYSITYDNGQLTVHAAPLTITADNTSKTYGQTKAFAGTEFTSTGLLNGDTVTSVTLNSTGAAAAATVSGSPYSIAPSAALGTGLSNYQITYDNGQLTVNTAALTITAKNISKTYGQTTTFAGTEFSAIGLANGDTVTSVTLTSTGTAATAGVSGSPYPILPSAAIGTGLGNYTISYANGQLTVDAAPLTITADSTSKSYGQITTFAGTEFTPSGLVNGDTVTSVTLNSAGAAATAGVSGSPYQIVPSAAQGTGLANYQITYDNGQLTVNPLPLSITADNTSKTYGQSTTFAGTEFTANGLVNGDTVTSVALNSAGAAVAAGVGGSPYPIVPDAAQGTGLANYTITYTNGQLTVNAAPLTITASDANKTYGQTKTFAGTEFTTSGLVNSDTVTSVALNSAGAAATAGVSGSPYSIVPSAAIGTGLANYSITYAKGQLTVSPAPLTIAASDASKTYGHSATFAGTEFTTNGLVNGDTVTSVTLVSAGTAIAAGVGGSPYPIVPSAAIGTGLANYSITYNNGQMTVDAAPLTITASDASKTYGQTTNFAGTEFTTNGLLNGDAVTSVTLNSPGAGAGAGVSGSPYPIAPSAAQGAGLPNYNITYANGQLTVNPAPLTITAVNQTKVYGAPLPALAVSYAGFVNGDTAASLATAPTLFTAATAGSHVAGGPYPIAANGAADSNYAISYVPGSLTVTPAVLAVAADSKIRSLGQANPPLTDTINGFVNGDAASVVSGAPSLSTTAAANSAAGSYPIVVGLGTLNATDYAFAPQNGTLTVTINALGPFGLTDDVYVVGSGTVVVPAAGGVLSNDSANGPLTVTAGAVHGANGGTFYFNADGSFTYFPPTNFPGFDDAQYTASDTQGDGATATVTVLSQTGGMVWKLYEQVLHRNPDDAGLQFWINNFLQGGKPGDFAVDFFESTELLNQVITGYYQQFLGRAPVGDDLPFWEAVWRKNGGPEQVKADFASSPEFEALAQQQYGAFPNGWLTALYQRILGRAPDQEGFDYWQKQLAGGMSQYQVALDFFTSPEAFDNDVTGWYYQYLGRAPTLAEQASYANQMVGGATDRAIEEMIVNLPEFSASPPAEPFGLAARLPNYLAATDAAFADFE